MASVLDLLPSGYGYVVLVFALYCFFNIWMATQVGKARKKYKVPYPALYALESENKDAQLFNCVQRGHQNSLEMMPTFFGLLLLGGLQYPVVAAVLGLVYIVARYVYFTGYSTGDPKNRLKGSFYALSLLGLTGWTISLGVNLLLRNGVNLLLRNGEKRKEKIIKNKNNDDMVIFCLYLPPLFFFSFILYAVLVKQTQP